MSDPRYPENPNPVETTNTTRATMTTPERLAELVAKLNGIPCNSEETQYAVDCGLEAIATLTQQLAEAQAELKAYRERDKGAVGKTDDGYVICLGYHPPTEERDGEFEWLEVVPKADRDRAREQLRKLLTGVDEGLADNDVDLAVRTIEEERTEYIALRQQVTTLEARVKWLEHAATFFKAIAGGNIPVTFSGIKEWVAHWLAAEPKE